MHATAERVSRPTSRRPAGKLARRASHRARDYERTEQTLRLPSEHSKNTHGRVLPSSENQPRSSPATRMRRAHGGKGLINLIPWLKSPRSGSRRPAAPRG